MLILYKNVRNVRFVLFTKTSSKLPEKVWEAFKKTTEKWGSEWKYKDEWPMSR